MEKKKIKHQNDRISLKKIWRNFDMMTGQFRRKGTIPKEIESLKMGSTSLRAPKLQTFETSKSPQNQEGLNITASSKFPNLRKLSGMLSHHATNLIYN
ncbi:hypothetical protein PSU51_20855 [Yersinia pestis]|nr:hypothetical protein [Yersinia pestis]